MDSGDMVFEIAKTYIKQSPNASVDDLEAHWEILASRGLQGKPITFGDRTVSSSEHGVFGLDGPPALEAIVIAVVAELVATAIKSGVSEVRKLLSDEARRKTLLRFLGGIGSSATKQAEEVIDWFIREGLDLLERLLTPKN